MLIWTALVLAGFAAAAGWKWYSSRAKQVPAINVFWKEPGGIELFTGKENFTKPYMPDPVFTILFDSSYELSVSTRPDAPGPDSYYVVIKNLVDGQSRGMIMRKHYVRQLKELPCMHIAN